MALLDFTSALYLGLRHPSESMASFDRLTTGKPAALFAPPEARKLAASLARLIGCEAAILGPSTLHMFLDLFHIAHQQRSGVIVVGDVYPIALWGIERAASFGAPVIRVHRHNVELVAHHASKLQRSGNRPIIFTDGISYPAARVPPSGHYARIAASTGGALVIEDTQALGILGEAPAHGTPYGKGGGGSLRFHGIAGRNLIVVSSLAKAFGVPLAVLASSARIVQHVARESATRVHCSPPSIPALLAGSRSVELNMRCGERLRRRLFGNVRRFRERLAAAGIQVMGGPMPVQTIILSSIDAALTIQTQLARSNIRVLAGRPNDCIGGSISLILTASHRKHDIDLAATSLARLLSTSDVRDTATAA